MASINTVAIVPGMDITSQVRDSQRSLWNAPSRHCRLRLRYNIFSHSGAGLIEETPHIVDWA